MKKICVTFLFACMAVGLFAQTNIGVIKEMIGTVELKSPGATSFTAAKVGDQLNQDTIISTGFKSVANIAIGYTQITVRPLTRLTLMEIQSSTEMETLNVSIQSGRVKVEVKPPVGTKAKTSFQSPEATASVRGTSFEFDTRNLYVDSGTVSFAGKRGQSILVNAGDSSHVEVDGSAASPFEVKVAAVLPPALAGDVTSIATGKPARAGVSFTMIVDFKEQGE